MLQYHSFQVKMSHKNVPEVVSTFSQAACCSLVVPLLSCYDVNVVRERNVCKCNKSYFTAKLPDRLILFSLVDTCSRNRLKTKDHKEHSGEYSCTSGEPPALQSCHVMRDVKTKSGQDSSLLPSRGTRRRPSRKEDEWLNIANHRDRKRLKVSQNANRKLWRMKQIMDSGEIVFGSLFCSVLIMPDVTEFGLPSRRQPRS